MSLVFVLNLMMICREHHTPEQHANGGAQLNIYSNGQVNANYDSANNSAIKGSQMSKRNRGHQYNKSGKNFLAANMNVKPSK